jgi:tetratricopeptide (TPR) repeat protein
MIKWLQNVFQSLGASGLAGNAEAAYQEKQYPEAKQQASEALRIYEENSDNDGILKCLYILGQSLRHMGDDAEAEKAFDKGQKIIAQTASEERSRTGSTDVANLLTASGHLKKAHKEPAKAEELYRQSLSVLQNMAGGIGPEAAETLQALGTVCMEKSEYNEAAGYLAQALELIEDFPNHWSFLENQTMLYTVLSEYATCMTKSGRTREGEQLEARAREIRESVT